MPDIFPRFSAALRNWAAAQLAQSSIAAALKKLAGGGNGSRGAVDRASDAIGGGRRTDPITPKAVLAAATATKRAARQAGAMSNSGAAGQAGSRADAFREAVLSQITKKSGNVGQIVEALLRPGGKSLANLKRELSAAAKLLEQFGYGVIAPEERTPPQKQERREPEEDVHFEEAGPDLGNYRVGGRRYKFAPDDPILTGEMIPVQSSNVHSIGYIWNEQSPMKGTLKVRFLGTDRGASPQTRGGKGPIYHYLGVHPDVFNSFRLAVSKGKFVWDRLRVRGTVSGHQFPYELAKLQKDGYVPRKATRIGEEEHFIRRTVKGKNGKVYRSELADEFVRMVGGNNPPPHVIAGRGAPNRGGPNRGKPNRGKP